MLCEEAEFLVDQSSRDQIKGDGSNSSKVLEADSILKALSIENETDVERLLGYFFETTTDEDEDSDAEDSGANKDPLAALRRTCKVKDGNVVATVRTFVADRAEKQSDDGAMQGMFSLDFSIESAHNYVACAPLKHTHLFSSVLFF